MSGSYRRILWAIVFTIVGYSPARADYHYASHEGSDEYPYTSWETAADSIQNAVNAATTGDTVYVGAGEWYETVAATVDHDSVAIIGMGMDSTFCYADEYNTPVMTIDYGCSVEGICFQHLDGWIALWCYPYAAVKVRNCKFLKSGSGVQSSGGPSEITDCIFDSCGVAIRMGLWMGSYHIANNLILYGQSSWNIFLMVDSAVVENNILINEPNSTVSNVSGSPDYCAVIRNNVAVYGTAGFSTSASQRYNNTAINMRRDNLSFGMPAQDGDTLFNNLLWGCRYGISIMPEAENCFINYNAFWENDLDIQPWGNDFDSVGNIFVNPMLVSGNDFHLQAFSPLIDAGDPDVFDVDGSRSDIGAYGGPFGQSYEYQDLPPAVPDSLSGQVIADTIFLIWRFNTEADFNNYYLYRDTVSGFEPSIFNLISEPDTSYYVDADIVPGTDYYYRISAIDNQGNESDYSEELEVLQTGVWNGVGAELPTITTIRSNYPNPFNSSTTIVYTVANLGPIPAQINIDVYDIMGRLVRRLVDERKEVGIYRITWDGKGDSGDDCPSGVYFARIVQWEMGFLGKHQKLMLLR